MDEGLVVVNRRGEDRIRLGHPWIFRSDVARADVPEPGCLVRVQAGNTRPLGFGLYSPRSEIQLRMVERGTSLSPTWLKERLSAAIEWRGVVAKGEEACRLVHGEGDGLPSLIVDRYADYLVIQTLSVGMDRLKSEVTQHLIDLLRPKGILERNDPKVRALEGLEPLVGVLHGEVPEAVDIHANGVVLAADLWKGQKTGLFLDQRENHQAAIGYARGHVLDVFAYQGGFGLAVARKAESVMSVEVSDEAIARLRANAQCNGLGNLSPIAGNAFDVLRDLHRRKQRFDTVILDPPAFAKSRDALESARRGYKEINLRALSILAPGGYLITCSCSHHVHEADFEAILVSAARDLGATVAIVEKRRQSRDHPTILGVPETYYLKCFVLRRLA